MGHDKQPETQPLSAADEMFRKRRRKELARELRGVLDKRGCRLLDRLAPRPTVFDHAGAYKTSRGKTSPGHSCVSQLYRLLLDLAVHAERPAEAVLAVIAEVQAVGTLLLDRVVGLGSPPDLQTAMEWEADAGSEDDVVSLKSYLDGEVDREERRQMLKAARRARTALRQKERALELYEPEAA